MIGPTIDAIAKTNILFELLHKHLGIDLFVHKTANGTVYLHDKLVGDNTSLVAVGDSLKEALEKLPEKYYE